MILPAIMIQGTGSDVGKTFLVAGICRALTNRGFRVRPFKPQNMSNNAAVADDGGEVGRAQALQAMACRCNLSFHMNPILLKPEKNSQSQVILQGKYLCTVGAGTYGSTAISDCLPAVIDSFNHLETEADIIVVEGAGSPAEVNLRKNDIANMGFALALDIPVVLAGDIDRGGVIAQIVGTCEVLSSEDRNQLKGFIINKFRGDLSIFDDGKNTICERSNLKSLGVLPWFPQARYFPAEDTMNMDSSMVPNYLDKSENKKLQIVMLRCPSIANFDDIDPLRLDSRVDLHILSGGDPIPEGIDLLILPGSKSTLDDLRYIREQGWDIDIFAFARRSGCILGICGGYQILGRRIYNSDSSTDNSDVQSDGLFLLDVETYMLPDKTVKKVEGKDVVSGTHIFGYEIHKGVTTGKDCQRVWLETNSDDDAGCALNETGRIMGCYVHGLFASDDFRNAFIDRIYRLARGDITTHTLLSNTGYLPTIDKTLDELGRFVEQHLDIDNIIAIAEARVVK